MNLPRIRRSRRRRLRRGAAASGCRLRRRATTPDRATGTSTPRTATRPDTDDTTEDRRTAGPTTDRGHRSTPSRARLERRRRDRVEGESGGHRGRLRRAPPGLSARDPRCPSAASLIDGRSPHRASGLSPRVTSAQSLVELDLGVARPRRPATMPVRRPRTRCLQQAGQRRGGRLAERPDQRADAESAGDADRRSAEVSAASCAGRESARRLEPATPGDPGGRLGSVAACPAPGRRPRRPPRRRPAAAPPPPWAPLTLVAFVGLVVCTNVANVVWADVGRRNPEGLLALSAQPLPGARRRRRHLAAVGSSMIGAVRLAVAFVVCHLVGRAYRDQALSWFTRYLGVTPCAQLDRFNGGFTKAEIGVPFFAGSNIVAVLTGVHSTPAAGWPCCSRSASPGAWCSCGPVVGVRGAAPRRRGGHATSGGFGRLSSSSCWSTCATPPGPARQP